MKAKTIKKIAVWTLIVGVLLLMTMVYMQMMEIPFWIEDYEGYSIVHYFRMKWVYDLCGLFG